jgi:hypothetical protein
MRRFAATPTTRWGDDAIDPLGNGIFGPGPKLPPNMLPVLQWMKQAPRAHIDAMLKLAEKIDKSRDAGSTQIFAMLQYVGALGRLRSRPTLDLNAMHEFFALVRERGVDDFVGFMRSQLEQCELDLPPGAPDTQKNFEARALLALLRDCDDGKVTWLAQNIARDVSRDKGWWTPEQVEDYLSLFGDSWPHFLRMDRHAAKGKLEPFLQFCRAVNGFPVPIYPTAVGPYLMALGRLFVGRDDAPMSVLADLVGEVEAARARGDDLPRNVPDAYSYLGAQLDMRGPMFDGVTLGQFAVQFSRAWARDGFPLLEVGHKVAASLMFTKGHDDVAPPWRAFDVRVPNNLVVFDGEELTRLLVWHDAEMARPWFIVCEFRCTDPAARKECRGIGMESYVHAFRVSSMDERVMLRDVTDDSAREKDPEFFDAFGKAAKLICRLVGGLCMLVSAKEGIEAKPYQPKPPANRHRPPGMEPPEGTRFTVSKNVQLDLREQVREYMAGGRQQPGRKLTVQYVVRGHRRWQACGAGMKDHRLIWIEPYWKGPLEARALVRGYELKGQGEGEGAPAGETPSPGELTRSTSVRGNGAGAPSPSPFEEEVG